MPNTLTGGAAPQAAIPRAPEVKTWLYQNAILGETGRFRQIERWEAHYLMSQYSHQTIDWWGVTADQIETVSPSIMVPFGFEQPGVAQAISVRQKRPTAPSNICRAVVDRFTGLVFSESRRPEVIVEGDPDTEDFLAAVREQMRFWPKWREARNMGGATGSVLVTAHLRQGRFSMEIHNPKHCQVVWKDRRRFEVSAVLILYRYPVEEPVIDPKTHQITGFQAVNYLYRRIITETDDTVYVAVKLEDGADLAWVPESTVEHNLGFFPGVWVQNMPVLQDVDGDPDCQGAWQAIDTYDRMLSQMNKGALLNLDPTPVIRSDPKDVAALQELEKGSDHAIYVGTSGDAHYMEISGSGILAGKSLLDVLKKNILDLVRCVMVDPADISGAAQSAKAIEYIYAPMLEKGDDLRSQYGDLGLLPFLVIVEKIARKFQGQSVELAPAENGTRRIGNFKFDLPPRRMPDGSLSTQKLGPGGYIRIKWGPFFSPSEDDKQKAINNAIAAKQGEIIDQETAVKSIAPIYEVRDTQGMLERIKTEADEEMQRALGPVEESAPHEEKPESSPFKAPSLTQAAIASILKVNEARAMVGLGPLETEDGTPDQEGFLTVVEYQAKHAGIVATVAKAEGGEGEDDEGASGEAPTEEPPAPPDEGGP